MIIKKSDLYGNNSRSKSGAFDNLESIKRFLPNNSLPEKITINKIKISEWNMLNNKIVNINFFYKVVSKDKSYYLVEGIGKGIIESEDRHVLTTINFANGEYIKTISGMNTGGSDCEIKQFSFFTYNYLTGEEKVYGPYGDIRRDQRLYSFSISESESDSEIVAFYGKSSSHLGAIGAYTRIIQEQQSQVVKGKEIQELEKRVFSLEQKLQKLELEQVA
nr:14963_t:CDS:1 [Entrophospora candida]